MAIVYGVVQATTIPNGAATPTVGVDIKDHEVVAVRTPVALTSTTMSFTAATTLNGTYLPVYKEDGTPYSVTVAATRSTKIDPAALRGLRFIKPVMGANEAAQRALELVTRKPT